MSVETVVAANGLSPNVLSGELFEILPANAVVELYVSGSAAGLRALFSIGGVQMLEDAVVNAQNRTPVVPDDLLDTEGGIQGSRLSLRFRNTTAGALTARSLVKITPA
ncbi:MAG: hypothetical protein ACRDHF_09290 [Tepidiformaceae bacterium]